MTTIDREAAIAILKAACDAAALKDYASKYTDNEEDLRACIYHHVRNSLDADDCWRVFLSFSTLRAGTDTSMCKPDLVFLRGQPVHKDLSLEILVELKNWPTLEEIRHDLKKLIELRARFPKKNRPDLVFFGIGRGLQALEPAVRANLSEQDGIYLWLYDHDQIYKGPWEEDPCPDPYRRKLRTIETATDETTT